MSTSTLLLLVHLYILNYPYANNTEYDHDLFNPRTRGLRDRTKAMEDITYFLVRQIEGGSPKTLTMYPCRQPSESLAFRTSLSKYLERLRHHSIRPPRASSSSAGVNSIILTAPWWKDVVVRKSLLEESAGEKFDRLILSLSTHALMKASHSIPQETMRARLHSEPVSYANALIKYQLIRQSWTRSASLLLRRQRDLKSLRVNFRSQSTQQSSKYERSPTARLVELAHSKYQDLLNSCAEETRPILVSFVELSGICNPFGVVQLPGLTDAVDAPCPLFSSHPLPLPIAAAHHPSYLRKFQHPLLQSSKKDAAENLPLKSHAGMVFTVQIEAEKRIQQVLANAVSHMGNRLLEVRRAITSKYLRPPLDTMSTFLQPLPSTFDIAHNPKPVKGLLNSIGLGEDFDLLEPDTEIDHELEKQVNNIRTSILPPFPAPSSELCLPRLRNAPIEPSQLKGVSRIPQLLKQSPKSKRSIRPIRKSVRFSTARRITGRPSIFGAFEDLDSSLDCLINETHDFPTDGEGTDEEIPLSIPFKTPNGRRKTPKVNRIWLPGTPASGLKGRTPKPRGSEALALERLFEDKPLAVELPSLGSLNNSILSLSDDPALPDHPKYSPTIVNRKGDGIIVAEDDSFVNDQPSLTLKELLLTADTGQFEFLADAEDESLGSSYLTNESSLSWE